MTSTSRDLCLQPAAGPLESSPARLPGPEDAQSESKKVDPAAPSEQSREAEENPPVQPGHVTRPSQSPKKQFSSIIEHLSVVFPCYDSTELAGFIKKVRNKNKNSLLGLNMNEVIERITEYIQDEQKKKPHPEKNSTSEACSAAAAARASSSSSSPDVGPASNTKGQKGDDVPATDANSCEICHEMFRSKNMRVLKCGHKFHKGCLKQWLKEQNTCPTCGCGDLLSEE